MESLARRSDRLPIPTYQTWIEIAEAFNHDPVAVDEFSRKAKTLADYVKDPYLAITWLESDVAFVRIVDEMRTQGQLATKGGRNEGNITLRNIVGDGKSLTPNVQYHRRSQVAGVEDKFRQSFYARRLEENKSITRARLLHEWAEHTRGPIEHPGEATIELADALEWIERQEPCDLLLTDPPYSTDVEDIKAFSKSWLRPALAKIKPTGRAYVFIGAYPEEIKAYLAVPSGSMTLANVLIWTFKNTLGPKPSHDYVLNMQAILYYRGPDAGPLDCNKLTEQISVHEFAHPARSLEGKHQWQKPIELAEMFVRHATGEGDLIFDPFACTGTFLLAAAANGRIGRGCEIEPGNCNIAVRRGCRYAD